MFEEVFEIIFKEKKELMYTCLRLFKDDKMKRLNGKLKYLPLKR